MQALIHCPVCIADPRAHAAALYERLLEADTQGWEWIAVERTRAGVRPFIASALSRRSRIAIGETTLREQYWG